MKVKFVPQNVEFEIKPGQTIMSLAHENGIVIHSTCNGMPSCAECRVRVTDGDWNLNPPGRKELSLIGTGYYIDQRRLSCQALCFGDVTVDLNEQVEKGAEGPVTKKFLTKVHKASAQESHSLGGVLIEQDGHLLSELKKDVSETVQPSAASASLQERRPQNQARGQNPSRGQSPSRNEGGGGGGGGGQGRSRGGRGRSRRGGGGGGGGSGRR